MNIESEFNKNTITHDDGKEVEISCRMGLWSVAGKSGDIERLKREAMHYFVLYWNDGEYLASPNEFNQ